MTLQRLFESSKDVWYLQKLYKLSLTLTSIWGKGPREFSGTLIGGMTQSLFCRLSPLAEELLWCFRENLITLGWESQTLDSISSMPTWKEKPKHIISCHILHWITCACYHFKDAILPRQVGRWIYKVLWNDKFPPLLKLNLKYWVSHQQ